MTRVLDLEPGKLLAVKYESAKFAHNSIRCARVLAGKLGHKLGATSKDGIAYLWVRTDKEGQTDEL